MARASSVTHTSIVKMISVRNIRYTVRTSAVKNIRTVKMLSVRNISTQYKQVQKQPYSKNEFSIRITSTVRSVVRNTRTVRTSAVKNTSTNEYSKKHPYSKNEVH
jgi:hypothetical protein